MLKDLRRQLTKNIPIILLLLASLSSYAPAQRRVQDSDLYALKDFGEFRLPASLRPMFDSQVLAGPVNHVDAVSFLVASSAKARLLSEFGDAWILIAVGPCDNRVCRKLTDPIDLSSPAYTESSRLRSVFAQNLARSGTSLLSWQPLVSRNIGGGRAACLSYQTSRDGNDGMAVNLTCNIDNYDREYSVGVTFSEKERSFWEPEIAKFLESIKILDRAPNR